MPSTLCRVTARAAAMSPVRIPDGCQSGGGPPGPFECPMLPSPGREEGRRNRDRHRTGDETTFRVVGDKLVMVCEAVRTMMRADKPGGGPTGPTANTVSWCSRRMGFVDTKSGAGRLTDPGTTLIGRVEFPFVSPACENVAAVRRVVPAPTTGWTGTAWSEYGRRWC